MWGAIATLGAKLATLANNAFAYFTKKDDQNTGRKLQTVDDLAAGIKGDIDAQAAALILTDFLEQR